MSASIQQAYPGGLQPEEKQETNPNHFQCVIRFFLVNSLDSGLLIIVTLIASGLSFYHWTNNVRYRPRNHPLSSLKMAQYKKAA